MPSKRERFRIAVLDDYQNVALSLADWSALDERATVTVFNDHLADSDAVVELLQPFEVVCVTRERTPMTRAIIERLPKLRLIASTGMRNASIDLEAAEGQGCAGRSYGLWLDADDRTDLGAYLASARNLVAENASLRGGDGSRWSATTWPGGRSGSWVSDASAARWRGSAMRSA